MVFNCFSQEKLSQLSKFDDLRRPKERAESIKREKQPFLIPRHYTIIIVKFYDSILKHNIPISKILVRS